MARATAQVRLDLKGGKGNTMRAFSVIATIALAALAGGCGGSGGSTPTPTPTSTTPPLTVTLSATGATVAVREAGAAQFGFDVTIGGLAGRQVFGDVSVGDRRILVEQVSGHNSPNMTVRLATKAFPAGGKEQSKVTFRLCEDAACNTVYPGTTRTFTVDLAVTLDDWAMFQRNAAHTAYVAVDYDPARFAQAWQWAPLDGSSPRPVSAEAGTVFVSEGEDLNPGLDPNDRLTALNSATGAVRWQRDLGNNYDVSGPTLGNGKLYLTLVANDNTRSLVLVDKQDGALVASSSFNSQLGQYPQPTLQGDQVFVAAGFYGSEVSAYNATTGAKQWEGFGTTGSYAGQALAVDASNIYYFGGNGIAVMSRANGALVRTISNPFHVASGAYRYDGALVLDGQGGAYGFRALRTWPYTPLPLVRLDVTGGSGPQWQTGIQYVGHPALAGDRLFALYDGQRAIHAIDTATGEIRDGIDVPGTSPLRYNLIATPYLLFVSTQTHVYAFSRGTRAMVWSAPTGGMLAITPDNLLLVSGETSVTAYRLY